MWRRVRLVPFVPSVPRRAANTLTTPKLTPHDDRALLQLVHPAMARLQGQVFHHAVVDVAHAAAQEICDFAPVFAGAHTLLVRHCEPEFVYHWVRPQFWPRVRTVVLEGDPGDCDLVRRFGADTTFHVWDPVYHHYASLGWWAPCRPGRVDASHGNVQPISHVGIQRVLVHHCLRAEPFVTTLAPTRGSAWYHEDEGQ